jgi:hypothetical protein
MEPTWLPDWEKDLEYPKQTEQSRLVPLHRGFDSLIGG